MGFFDMFKKIVPGIKNDEVGSSPSAYNMASIIAGLIDNTPIEMLMNKKTRLVLYNNSDIDIRLNVCFVAHEGGILGGEPIAEVFFNTLRDYKIFILTYDTPETVIHTDQLAREAAEKLLKQAGLF
jgi:hypothetical protein